MKSLPFLAILLVLVSTSFFTGCTRENTDYISSPKEIIARGPWGVDYFFDGQDMTSQYNSYQFHFSVNGDLLANDGTTAHSGTWSMVTDVNRNQVLRMNIQEAHLQILNEGWIVTASSPNSVDLKRNGSELRLRKL